MSYTTDKEYFVVEQHRNGPAYAYFCDEQSLIETAVDLSNRFNSYKLLSVTDLDSDCNLSGHLGPGNEIVMCVFRPVHDDLRVYGDIQYSLFSKDGLLGSVLPKDEPEEDEPKEYITLDGVKYKRVD